MKLTCSYCVYKYKKNPPETRQTKVNVNYQNPNCLSTFSWGSLRRFLVFYWHLALFSNFSGIALICKWVLAECDTLITSVVFTWQNFKSYDSYGINLYQHNHRVVRQQMTIQIWRCPHLRTDIIDVLNLAGGTF